MNARELADPNNQLVISHPAPGEMSIQNFEKKTAHTFEFEQIFDSTKKQAEIFAEVSDLVVSVLDGYNVWSADMKQWRAEQAEMRANRRQER